MSRQKLCPCWLLFTLNGVLAPWLLTSAASASDTDLARQLWLLTPVPPSPWWRTELQGYQLRPVAMWWAGVWSVVQGVTTERSVVLKVSMFLSWNPSQQSTVCFHVIPLRLIARGNENSFLCKVAVNLNIESPRWLYGSGDVHSMDSFLRRQKEETICLVRAWTPPRWCRNTAATRQNMS